MHKINFFGLNLTIFTKSAIGEIYHNVIATANPCVLFGWSLTTIPKIKEYPRLVSLVNSFEFNIPDGRGLYFILKLMGYDLSEHFSIPDMVEHILCLANDQKIPIYLLGGTEHINEMAKKNIENKYFSIPRVGGRNGYFSHHKMDEVISDIRKTSPGIILIGISSPLKEEAAMLLRLNLSSCVIVPCGGVIDILGGKTSREPKILQKLALAWLYRFCLEPKRLFGPVLVNGIKCICVDLPVCFFQKYILKKSSYTFEQYYS